MQKSIAILFKMGYNNYVCAKNNLSLQYKKRKRKVKEKDDGTKQMDEENKCRGGNAVGACYDDLCGKFPNQGHHGANHRLHHQTDR